MFKRITATLMALFLVICLLPVGAQAETYSGQFGEGLTWNLDTNTGTLVISGNGRMNCSVQYTAPWLQEGGEYIADIVTVIIEDGVTAIDEAAFDGCFNLTSISIPDSVTYIGGVAFRDCTSLTSISIPDTVECVGPGAFTNCTNLAFNAYGDATYLGNSGNPYHVFVKTNGAYEFMTVNGSDISSFAIHEDTKVIAGAAFWWDTALTEITIPDGVVNIGEMAFVECSALTAVTIPASVTEIGIDAFGYCASLTEILFEGDAPSIGSYAFGEVTATAYYPAGNETWTEEVMQNYGGTITWVPYETQAAVLDYGTCGKSLSWELTEDGVLTITGIGEMYNYGLYGIGYSSPWFSYRKDIKEIVIADTVTTIGNEAFYGCSAITAVTIPEGVTTIGRDAFTECAALASVTFPQTLTEIGHYAFGWCSSLTSITIPAAVTTIGDFAFGRCTGLSEITFLGDCPAISQDAFSRVVANAYYPKGNATWDVLKLLNYGGTLTWIPMDASAVVLGDVNGDGQINTTDAKLIMQLELGLIDQTELDTAAADVNGDGQINTTDAKLIMQLELGLITGFTAP